MVGWCSSFQPGARGREYSLVERREKRVAGGIFFCHASFPATAPKRVADVSREQGGESGFWSIKGRAAATSRPPPRAFRGTGKIRNRRFIGGRERAHGNCVKLSAWWYLGKDTQSTASWTL